MPFSTLSAQVSCAFVVGIFVGLSVREIRAALSERIATKRIMRGVDQMPELNHPWIHMKDPQHVKDVITEIISDGKDQLQVIADFDRTLTRFAHNGMIIPTCHGIMDSSHLLPKEYRDKSDAMRKHYYAIEIDPTMTPAQKTPYMVEWWTKAHALMTELQIRKDELRTIVHESDIMLREGCDVMFSRLDELAVPLLIFSAGIGDIIYEGIEKCATYHDNMRIVSNFMDFNGQGVLSGFRGDLIHSFNKNENAIHDSDYFQKIKNRTNVILLGDTMGDLRMADGAGSKHCLKIGFLNDKIEERLETYKDAWDIVLVADDTVDVVNAILRYLV